MMMMMGRVMCVLAVVLCCACGYTMTAAAAVDNDSPSGRGVSRGAVEVSCAAGGALRVRPAAESEWLTCGAGSRVSACGKYADLCRQRTARAARTTTTIDTTTNGQLKAVMAYMGSTRVDVPEFTPKRWQQIEEHKKSKNNDHTRLTTEEAVKLDKELTQKEMREKEKQAEQLKQKQQELAEKEEMAGRLTEQQEQERRESKDHERSLQQTKDTRENENLVQEDSEVARPSVPAVGEPESTPVVTTATDPLPTKAAESHSTPEGSTESERTENPPTREHSTEGVDTKQTNPQTQSENTTTSSEETNTTTPPSTENTVSEVSTATPSRDSNLTTQSTATDDVTAAPNSTETNTTTPQSTENTTTEALTNTPSPVPDPQISNIAPTVQNKANVDSSVSPVWICTAAPLLIVAVLFSVTVC
ncbi:uncharacterized protein TM35_000451290 [Trypanosoma theileri]|uniref:Mucin-associated surface protein (MASP) n=1 Tax=Trypanosoma theileri TaxID=67003 RepID=A0A1X0NIH8_9TRYP|nr:uncharacterized protein TM35_000451290 [Trypanosoma theileri]ORC84391.1 hypothetical protein TM35_000451290 [Trypanosoma theileri]